MGIAGTHPSVGMPIGGIHPFDAYKNPPPPAPMPVIAGCPNDTCDGSPGDYTLNVPWTVTCRTNNCSWGLIFRATVDTADYENNVWVGNIINSTGAAGRAFCTGPGCSTNQSVWWVGYGIYQNVIVKNNYADLCGIGGRLQADQGHNRTSGLSLRGPDDDGQSVVWGGVPRGFSGRGRQRHDDEWGLF